MARDVEETIIYLSERNIQLDDSLLFDQLTYLNKKIKKFKNSISDWENKITSDKWQFFLVCQYIMNNTQNLMEIRLNLCLGSKLKMFPNCMIRFVIMY